MSASFVVRRVHIALILCPVCKKQISDKAEKCPHCGLPATYFPQQTSGQGDKSPVFPEQFDYKNLDLFSLRCPICGFPLKYEFNKNYGLNLWICTNDAEVCDFMTNDRVYKHDICKCPQCKDGYLIVKVNPKNQSVFYGCTNYYRDTEKCGYMRTLPNDPL